MLLEGEGRIRELPAWLGTYRDLSDRLRESRPDVSETLASYLSAFCTVERAAWIADVSLVEPDGKSAAAAMIGALGPALGKPFTELLERDAERDAAARQAPARGRAVVQVLTEHAALLAPALAPLLQGRTPGVLRTLLRTLGFGGPGWEESIAAYVADSDEQTAREALRALARVGTPKAASLVVAEIERQHANVGAAAEETLWHFPVSEAQRRTRELLGRRDFTMRHPEATERLLDRAARSRDWRSATRADRARPDAFPHLESGTGPRRAQSARDAQDGNSMTLAAATEPSLDPLPLLKGLASLRKLTGMYPPGHPAITQKLGELDSVVQRLLRQSDVVRIDIIHGDAHLDGLSFRHDSDANARIIHELAALGIDSIHIRRGISPDELQALSTFLWELKDTAGGPPLTHQLASRGIRHVSLARLIALDTRWRAEQWADAPKDIYDPAYAESLDLMHETFEQVQEGRELKLATIRHIVELLVQKVAGSSAALAQILAVKLYENLTYCHSVNVATLSLLIAKQIGFDAATTAAIGEAALLHDIGKTRIPLEVIRKPGALDKRERALMESHTTYGAEILVEVDGLRPLTPTVALEHHRSVKGSGYPELGDQVPHFMSQLVSVADIYEAMTGARTYQAPSQPEQACLVLARLAGGKLNSALVKAFVAAVTFFPVGSVVRTSRDETGVVVATNALEPLHPVIALVSADFSRLPGDIDTSARDSLGGYARHIVETIRPPEPLDLSFFV